MDPVKLVETLADKIEGLATSMPEDSGQEKQAGEIYVDSRLTLDFLKFFVGCGRR